MMRVPLHRILRPALLLSTLACSALLNVAQAAEPAKQGAADSEAETLRALGISPQMALRYQDEAGRRLTREAFHERLSAGAGTLSFHVRKSEQEAVLQLQPAGPLPGASGYEVAAGEMLPAFSLRALDQTALTPETL